MVETFCIPNIDLFFQKEQIRHQFRLLKEKFISLLESCPGIMQLFNAAVIKGYKFVGEPKSHSSQANTNTKNKTISITDKYLENETPVKKIQRQLLSLAYELTNANNEEEINRNLDGIKSGEVETAEEFVNNILTIEAKAQFTKISTCLKLAKKDRSFLDFLNPLYLKVFNNSVKENKEKGEIILDLKNSMEENGKLKRTGKKITDHYSEIFYKEIKRSENLRSSPVSVIDTER